MHRFPDDEGSAPGQSTTAVASLLVAREGETPPSRAVPLTGTRWVVGRSPDADVQIDDATMSREHLQLSREGAAWWVHDLGSTNGTYVNGRLVRRRIVRAGDTICAGRHALRLAFSAVGPIGVMRRGATLRCRGRLAAAVERELEQARALQERLVPAGARFASLDVAVGFRPCAWVGGDYADALTMDDGRILIVVADVCGKGIEAALVASCVHALVHTLAGAPGGLAELGAGINRYLCRFLPPHSFVTMVAVAVHPYTGELECLNAGHPPALVLSASGGVTPLGAGQNVALGLLPVEFSTERGVLPTGDALLLYTDGVTDCDQLSQERLARIAAEAMAAERPACEIRAALARAIEHRPSDDDRAFLVAKRARHGAGHGDPRERRVA